MRLGTLMGLAGGALAGVLLAPGEAQAQNMVQCESRNRGVDVCRMNTRGGISVYRQLSSSPCIPGRSYIWDNRGVLVRYGCRAVFANRYHGWGGNSPNWGPIGTWRPGWDRPPPGGGWGGGWSNYYTVRCDSVSGRQQRCSLPRANQARLLEQTSGVRCVRGNNWGTFGGGVWVANGCRGVFGSPR
jgi:hypothetical protein